MENGEKLKKIIIIKKKPKKRVILTNGYWVVIIVFFLVKILTFLFEIIFEISMCLSEYHINL